MDNSSSEGLGLSLHDCIGQTLSSSVIPDFTDLLVKSSTSATAVDAVPDIKTYPDAVYLNYYTLGLSFLYRPTNGYQPPKVVQAVSELQCDNLTLETIDIYNVDIPVAEGAPQRKQANAAYSPFPGLPVHFQPTSGNPPRPPFFIRSTTTGKDLVQALGEPARKGGGEGPRSGSIDIWCEWTSEGLMAEFGGDEARGPQAWERGKDARWKVITFFEKGVSTK